MDGEFSTHTSSSVTPAMNQTYDHNLSAYRQDGPARVSDVRVSEWNTALATKK